MFCFFFFIQLILCLSIEYTTSGFLVFPQSIENSSRQFYLNFVLLKNMFILRLPWFWIHIVCKLHSYFLRSALNCHNFVWKLIGPWLVRVYHLSLAYTFYSCSKFNLDYGVEPLMRPAVCFHHYIFVFLYFGFWSILLFVPFELSISNTNDW